MDVGQLGGHVLARNEVAGVRCALAATCGLRLNGNPIPFCGGVNRTAEGGAAVQTYGRGAPAAWQSLGTQRSYQAGGTLHAVATGEALHQCQVTIKANLVAAILRLDAGEWNSVRQTTVGILSHLGSC